MSTSSFRITDGLCSLSIPSHLLVEHWDDSSFVLFGIVVSTQDRSFLVYRRYSQFYQLHQHIEHTYALHGLDLPPRTLFRSLDESFLSERREKLQSYLWALMRAPLIFADSVVQYFFNPCYDCSRSEVCYTRISFCPSLVGNIVQSSNPRFSVKDLNTALDQLVFKSSAMNIDYTSFLQLCEKHLHFTSQFAIYQLFQALDTKCAGRIPLANALCSLSVLSNSPADHKVKFSLRVFPQVEKVNYCSKEHLIGVLSSWASVTQFAANVDTQGYILSVVDEARQAGVLKVDGALDANGYSLIATKNATTLCLLSYI
eukprot:TRINITY_DN12264_c0_g1_i1.p1 TRINITY_DN12264_c0_g1~~TRINITY_DN12264_c0_g1_i1.p1  ORF type:complete len:314 (-),score=54.39 TRINITY_DN12264_c0_g1_i1:270-1211(-)